MYVYAIINICDILILVTKKISHHKIYIIKIMLYIIYVIL